MRRHLGHASSGTRGTKAAPLATERHQQLVVAGVTAQAEEAVRQDTAPQIVIKFTFHIHKEARGLGVVMARGEEGLQVLRNHFVEHRIAVITRCVGGNRWRHTSPHRQHGEEESARSCPPIYCSNVQYTSKKLTRECGGNMRGASPCCAAVPKSAFGIPIHSRSDLLCHQLNGTSHRIVRYFTL